MKKLTPVATVDAKRPKSEKLLLLLGVKPLGAEDTTLYKSVTMRVNDVSGSSRPVIRWTTRDEESHDERPRGTQTCSALTLDQAWERGATHHRIEQWRV